MDYPLATPQEIVAAESLIESWMAEQLADENTVSSVERDPERGTRRWVMRLEGEQKNFIAIWFTLGQRNLHVESYFMPAPEENEAQVYEYLMRRAEKMIGFSFAIGVEDAVFLIGRVPVKWIDEVELDRLLGSIYFYTEQSFRPAMRLGFASRFKD